MTKPVKRPKFEPRSILLRSAVQVDTVRALVGNIPLDPDRPLEVLIRELPKVRGLDQNGLYWKRMGEIADQAWIQGKQFNSDAWHEYCKIHIMPEMITTKDGKVCSKWTETPHGKLMVISTTQLEKACFADYTTLCEAFGASLGVQFSVNPRHE